MNALARVDGLGTVCFAPDGRRLEGAHVRSGASACAEDPATGSAAGPLAVHLARHGRIAFGEEIEIEQGVEIGRPVDALRAGRRLGRRDRARAGRRLGGDRRARRVRLFP